MIRMTFPRTEAVAAQQGIGPLQFGFTKVQLFSHPRVGLAPLIHESDRPMVCWRRATNARRSSETSMRRTTIVVPCYNEANRFDQAAFAAALEADPWLSFTFVDDGSQDQTRQRLDAFAATHPDRCRVVTHERNRGKAEAVRTGLLDAFASDADYCGFWDADLATPLDELPRFIEVLETHPLLDLAIGSRVKLLGRSIDRNPLRHYLGRVAATIASLLLDLPVYDTQCGAKLFRNTPAMAGLFGEPLLSGWVFDVEIIARMVRLQRNGNGRRVEELIYEVPLHRWRDVAGSKIRPADYLRAFVDVLRVYRRTLRR